MVRSNADKNQGATLTKAQVERYRDLGYLVVPDVLDTGLLGEIRRLSDDLSCATGAPVASAVMLLSPIFRSGSSDRPDARPAVENTASRAGDGPPIPRDRENEGRAAARMRPPMLRRGRTAAIAGFHPAAARVCSARVSAH
jgi:hypothetical protein